MPQLFLSGKDSSLPLSLITITLSMISMVAISVAYMYVLKKGNKNEMMTTTVTKMQDERLISKDSGFG